MSKSAENMTENLAPCPFCGSRDLSIERFTALNDASKFFVHCKKCGMSGPSLVSVYCHAGAVLPDLTNAWNSRVATAPKHRPAEVCTGKDRGNIREVLFQNNIHVEHVLPLHAAPDQMGLHGSWEVLGEALRERDAGQLEELFPAESGKWLAEELEDNEALLCALRQIGGWAILGSYATVGKISLKENDDFASCSVYCGIERGFIVWGRTYKQAIAKAINAQRRYFDGEVAKAREAAGHGRA